MIFGFLTFGIAFLINLATSVIHVKVNTINQDIKTFSINISASSSIDIGTKKIDDLFKDIFKKELKENKIKENTNEPDINITIKINNFEIKNVLGLENKKSEVSISGNVSFEYKNNKNKSFENSNFYEKIEIDYKEKDKKEKNASLVIKKYINEFIKNNLC